MKTTVMMMIKRFFLITIFFSIAGISFSQNDDFGLWLGVNARHELLTKLDAEISGCLRTFNNASQIEQSFIEGGLKYNLNKYISLSGYYRLISKLEDYSKYYFRHKLFLDIKTTVPVGNFSFSGRARILRTTKTYIEDEEDLISKYYGRLKLKAEYDIPSFPLAPYLYFEPFTPVSSDAGLSISKYRLSAGTELKINRRSSLDVGYIFQRDYLLHISNEHIISLTYKIKF
jgi:hypothetical protein